MISAYSSPICLDVIRKKDAIRSKEVFKSYRPDWTDEQFAEAELLVSGIEYATMMTAGEQIPLETRIEGAMDVILGIYGVPEEIRAVKVKKVFAMDYRTIGTSAIAEFKDYVKSTNDQAFRDLLRR